MWPFNASETIQLVGAVFLGLVQLSTVLRVQKVYHLTNSRLTRIEGELAAALSTIAKQDIDAYRAETVRDKLATSVATTEAIKAIADSTLISDIEQRIIKP